MAHSHSSEVPPSRFYRLSTLLCMSVGILTLFFMAIPAAARSLPEIRIGVILDGPWTGNDSLLELFKTEILALTKGEFDVSFPEDTIMIGDWTQSSVDQAANLLLADNRIDVILAMGVLTSQDLARRGPLAKPTIATFTVDREIQLFPFSNGTSGVRNFTYIAPPSPIARDLQTFQELLPFRRLAVLVNKPYHDAIPALVENLQKELETMGVESVVIPVGASSEEALEALPAETEAVYVTPLLRLPSEEFQHLVTGLIEKKLPSFSYFGQNEVQQGILAGSAPSSDFPRLARRTALHLQRILLGESPGSLPIHFSQNQQLTINMATARKIGFSPRWNLLIEAELVEEEPPAARCCLSLESTMREAAAVNLQLAADERRIAASEEEVRKARASLLPQLLFSSSGVLIDEDRAEASFGTQAEKTLSSSLLLRQSLYSDQRWTNLAVQRHRQKGLLQEQAGLRLDIIQQAATGYLDVLRAKTVQSIRRNNLDVTRSNLNLARMRRSVGFSGPAEVYRWESQLAQDRKAVIDAETRRNLAEIALNRILQRPAEEAFLTSEVGLDDPDLILSDPRLAPYLDNPLDFGLFRDFMVAEGQSVVPELQRIDAAIDANQRIRLSARRAFWVPEVSMQAGLTQILGEGGAGTEVPFANLSPLEFPEANDTSWSVGINLTLPLFTGGSRRAELARANEELARLRIERQVLADRIEQRIRSALHQARASRSGIRLSRQGAEAAHKNLELVTDAYSRGVVSIIELLDAQNAALTSDLVAANAVYDFFVDLIETQRAVGHFDFFLSQEEKELWFANLAEFWQKARGDEAANQTKVFDEDR